MPTVRAILLPAKESKTATLPERATGLDLCRALELAPDAWILVRGDVPIPIDEPLRDGEELKLITVVSGG